MKERRFSFENNSLDAIRLFAAIQIAATHYLNLQLLHFPAGGWQDGLLLSAKRALTLFPGLILLFSISGFLMGASMERSKGRLEFLKKRVLRIYPGLWAAILAMAALAVLFVRPGGEELRSLGIWMVVQGLGLAYTTGFMQELGTGSMNGTLWTIMVEMQLYLLLVLFWKRIGRMKKAGWGCLLALALAANLACGWAEREGRIPEGALSLLSRTFLPYAVWFAAGLCLYRFRETALPALERGWVPLLALYALYKGSWQAFGWNVPGYYADFVTSLALPCLAIVLAYAWGKHRFRQDLSYGIFLYHWPLINLIFAWRLPERWDHIPLFLGYAAAFLLLGGASWFLVERPAFERAKALPALRNGGKK